MTEQKNWNWSAIGDIIPAYEDKIQTLNPGCQRCLDKLVWLPVRSGEYTTRSGYGISSLQDLPITQTVFNWQANLWKLKANPKLKMFMWKSLMNALPVGIQLFRRRITENFNCFRCNQPESINHMLFSCEFVAQVWSLAPVSHAVGLVNLSLQGLLKLSKTILPAPPVGIKSANLFVWICWGIWTARNQAIFNNTHYSPMEIITKAIRDAKCWELAQETLPIHHCKHHVTNLPSITSGFMVFIDAAWQANSKIAGLGWHYQAPEKVQLGEHSDYARNIPSALMAEAQALRRALNHALELNRTRLTVCSDSQILVRLIKSKGSDNELYGLLEEIKLLENSFVFLDVCYIPRSLNAYADCLAKAALQTLNLSERDSV